MLSAEVRALLDSLRVRIRRYVVLDSSLAIIALLLSAFWVGLIVDYTPIWFGGSEMPRSARTVLLAMVGLGGVVIVITLLLARLQRSLPDESLALLVERHYPQLGGRLITAVQLLRPNRQHDVHSTELLHRVHMEAIEKIDEVDPARVFRSQPLIQKSAIVVPLLLLMIGFAIVNPDAFARAAGRLTLMSDSRWPRLAQLEMVGVELPVVSAMNVDSEEVRRIEFDAYAMQLPKGSSATLRIKASTAEGKQVPALCTVTYKTDDGTQGQSNMRRVGRERDGYQAFILDGPPLSNLSESFTFSVRGLDDRLEEYRIEAVDPPTIAEMNVRVRYPDYLRSIGQSQTALVEQESIAFDLETPYQAGLRISEGSDVTLEAVNSVPIGEMDAVVETDQGSEAFHDFEFSEDRKTARLVLAGFRRPTAVRLVPSDSAGISAQAPFRYFLGAIVDEPPTVELALDGIQSAVTPIARLPLRCVVQDDYAVESLAAFVAHRRGEEAAQEDGDAATEDETDIEESTAATDYTRPMMPDREGEAATTVDLRELVNSGTLAAPKPGDTINVYAEAKDGYDLDGVHVTVSEVYRFEVVTAADLLSLLERRELGLRTRLEQTVVEMQSLRDQLIGFQTDGFEIDIPQDSKNVEEEKLRGLQILRLRIQQPGLQVNKAVEEIKGIAESLDDILKEMVNNRVDSPDRQERLGSGVRDPLRAIATGSMPDLKQRIDAIEAAIAMPNDAATATDRAVESVDQVLLELTAVLEKMLDLESYNEILDLVRGLIDDQEDLTEKTQAERKKAVLKLFE